MAAVCSGWLSIHSYWLASRLFQLEKILIVPAHNYMLAHLTHPALETVVCWRTMSYSSTSQGLRKCFFNDRINFILPSQTKRSFSLRTQSPGYPSVIQCPSPHPSSGFPGVFLGVILGRASPAPH